MAIPYEQWLRATGRTSTAANALIWKKTHGHALGLYDPEGNPVARQPGATTAGAGAPAPVYTPGALDASAITEIANLDHWKGIADAAAERNYTQGIAEINAQRAIADYNQQTGMRDVGRAHGGRGTSRSGMKLVDEGEVGARRLQEETGFNLAATAAANARREALDRNTADYQSGRAGALQSFGERDFAGWSARNPVQATGGGDANPNPIQAPGAPRVGTRTSPGTVPAAKRNLTFNEFAKLHPNIRNNSVMQTQYRKYQGGR